MLRQQPLMGLGETDDLRDVSVNAAEVICLTETHAGLLYQHGHTISSQSDYGYKVTQGRRKVILWSREP